MKISRDEDVISFEFHFPRWLSKLWWFMTGSCTECGGELIEWSSTKAWCENCGKNE